MKMQDVEVGGRYTAKVSGRIQVVRVVETKEIPPASWSARQEWRKLIYAVNEGTGKKITIRSAQRLRSRVDDGVQHEASCRRNAGGCYPHAASDRRWTAVSGHRC